MFKKFTVSLPYIWFGLSILLLFSVRLVSFNYNVLNHDELEWLYGIHRTQIDPRPFVGFEAHTSGPVSVYFLSLINLFVSEPQTIHLRFFCFFFLIVPTMALLFWGKRNYLNYAGLAFFTTLLSINFQQFEWYFEDLFCYNTEFQILFFTALLYKLLVINPRRKTVLAFSLMLVLFLFVKIQVVFFVLFFGLAMLIKLAFKRSFNLLFLYLGFVVFLFATILAYLLVTNTLSESIYIYIEKNIMYQSNISGEQIDWFLVAKRIISSFFHQFRYNSLALVASVITLIIVYFKRLYQSDILVQFFTSRIFLTASLFMVSLITILFSKNNFGHYFIVAFFPMAIFFSELYYCICKELSGQRKSLYSIGIFLCFLIGLNYNYLGKSLHLLTAKPLDRAKYQLGFPKGFQVDNQLTNWLKSHHIQSKNTILYLGWFNAQMVYYELGRSYYPVYRSANFFWYKLTYENKNREFFNHEEANLMEDLRKTPPFYIVDSEALLSKIKNTEFTRYVDANYFVAQLAPGFKIYQRKN
jgi:hypothetical protein